MEKINKSYDELQNKYGSDKLNSVYGYGKRDNAKVALVFMNPTKRNIATSKEWTGIRAQWLGTKQVWSFLAECGFISKDINSKIQSKKPKEWTPEFCEEVYDDVTNHGVWITNLAKCTQEDARELPDEVFLNYLDLLKQELSLINPEKIILFGNQVSSIVLNEKICVSQVRKTKFNLPIKNKSYEAYAVYYPVGNGRFNQPKAIEDILYIKQK